MELMSQWQSTRTPSRSTSGSEDKMMMTFSYVKIHWLVGVKTQSNQKLESSRKALEKQGRSHGRKVVDGYTKTCSQSQKCMDRLTYRQTY